ncbi:MAG TPA: efflux RND transporter periplasmic adaptor subunit [Candidatus Obscuribacterales bacterium]
MAYKHNSREALGYGLIGEAKNHPFEPAIKALSMETPQNHKIARRPIWIVGGLIVIGLIGWYVWEHLFDISYRPIKVTGTIQAKEILVASKVGGRIAAVLAEEGQTVSKGQRLVEFEVPELEARRMQYLAHIKESEAYLAELKAGPRYSEIEKARAEANQAQANWEMLKRGYRQEEIEKARAQRIEAQEQLNLLERGYRAEEIATARDAMEQAKIQMDWAEHEFKRYSGLASQGAVSSREADELKIKGDAAREAYEMAVESYRKMQSGPRKEEIDAARQRLKAATEQEKMLTRGMRPEEIKMAQQKYRAARASLRLLEEGTRKEQIARAEAKLAQMQASLQELDAQLKDRFVYSPADAEVSVMDLHAGQVIAPNKSIATLTRLDDMWTRVYLPERELGRVHVGQMVAVRADAFPTREFVGKIVQIPGVAEFTPRNVQTAEERSAQVFGLKIKIDNKDKLLRGGMNAEVTLPPVEGPFFKLARKENAPRHSP